MSTHYVTQKDAKTHRLHLFDESGKSLCGEAERNKDVISFVISSTLFWDQAAGACEACYRVATQPAAEGGVS